MICSQNAFESGYIPVACIKFGGGLPGYNDEFQWIGRPLSEDCVAQEGGNDEGRWDLKGLVGNFCGWDSGIVLRLCPSGCGCSSSAQPCATTTSSTFLNSSSASLTSLTPLASSPSACCCCHVRHPCGCCCGGLFRCRFSRLFTQAPPCGSPGWRHGSIPTCMFRR